MIRFSPGKTMDYPKNTIMGGARFGNTPLSFYGQLIRGFVSLWLSLETARFCLSKHPDCDLSFVRPRMCLTGFLSTIREGWSFSAPTASEKSSWSPPVGLCPLEL